MFSLPAPSEDPVVHAILGVVCLWSAWTDLKDQSIWDLVTLPAMVLGLVLGWLLHGTHGLFGALGGLGLAVIVFGAAYVLGLVESGDLFLMAAVGALLRFPAVGTAMLLATLFGLPVAVFWLTWTKSWRRTLGNYGRLFRRHWQGEEDMEVELTPFPFGVAISLAAVYTAAAAYWPILLLK